ncbi:MAG: hypothetical protein F4245_03165 [Cenarchaeum sp. SB0678_bin_8]|nr:hypothetical protein [Cenarchaeum sp. SB0666_bin_15]MYB47289.1 hypothetical protein [Cenarchaeum sp. SB0662_bin_33]MYD58600.1 hypothetical protein [Cenarchaeum sp. SB0678_bin_8]
MTTYLLATRATVVSNVQLGRDLGIKYISAWLLLRNIRESWRTIAGPDLLSGPPRYILVGAKRTRRARGRSPLLWASETRRPTPSGLS